jgi:Domain of unknown function (DUF4407)
MNDPAPYSGRRGRLGNALITLGGADKTALPPGSPDRGYFIGVGSGLLFTATLSALSMTLASSIAFAISYSSPGLYFLGVVWFMLIFGLDRWLVSDAVSGFAKPASGPAVAAWVGHAVVELFKISPRILIALVSSVLFAKFVMLAVYNTEIQAQVVKIHQQQSARYDQDIKAAAQNIKDQANSIIAQAGRAETKLEDDYKAGQAAIASAYKTEQLNLAAANKRGVYCTEQATYTPITNAAGFTSEVFAGDVLVCPPELQTITSTYQHVVDQYPETQAGVNTDKAGVAKRYGVAQQETLVRTALATAEQAEAPYKPQPDDGLLAREHALQLLTSAPSAACPTPPSEQDIATNDACISMYSPGAAAEKTIFQYFLLVFEMMPVLMKLINSLTKRRAYAWEMAAREAVRREDAEEKIAEAKKRAETDLAAFARLERARLEEAGALEEYKLRELARQERRLGLRRLQARVTAAIAEYEPTRLLRDFRSGRRPEVPDNVVSMASYIDPRDTASDPGIRVIENENFLY